MSSRRRLPPCFLSKIYSTIKGLDCPGSESRWGREFPHLSELALRPTQPPIQWIPGVSGDKAAAAWRWPPTTSSAEVKGSVELCICSHSGPSWSVLGWILPLTLTLDYYKTSYEKIWLVPCRVITCNTCNFAAIISVRHHRIVPRRSAAPCNMVTTPILLNLEDWTFIHYRSFLQSFRDSEKVISVSEMLVSSSENVSQL
jgi:hypothetical protein